jgi:hypothetical protein
LDRSEFTLAHSRFRTRASNQQLIIEGPDEKRLSNLIHLAHELGHCLNDSQLPVGRRGTLNLAEFIRSETVAHLLERVVAFTFIANDTDLGVTTGVTAYFEVSDALNIYFAAREVTAILGDSFPHPELFPYHMDCLREPIHVYPGLQIAYAWASHVRRKTFALDIDFLQRLVATS